MPPTNNPGGPHFENKDLSVGSLNQAAGHNYIGSVHLEGGGTAIVLNGVKVERRWTRPTPPPLLRDAIPRQEAIESVTRLLQERGQVTLSGRTSAAAVQGMPGIGKTILARFLSNHLVSQYPDGVLWQELGPDLRSADKAQPILDQWAGYALDIPLEARASLHFDPASVRSLLGEHSHLLVVLDNVWSLDAIRPLRDALPPQAHLLVTTRSSTVARGLGGARYELPVLKPEEARALIALRLGIEHAAAKSDWCDELAAGLGFHTLALDVALGRLLYEGDTPDAWQASTRKLVEHVRSGQGLGELHLEEEDREQNIERVLSYSYLHMDETAQRCFRLLGAFAPDSSFDTGAVAQMWMCSEKEAKRQLDSFVNTALLNRMAGGRWVQHGVLRSYALALLHRTGEYENAANLHAHIYDEAMEKAASGQRFASIRSESTQLHHAFEWLLKNDLSLSLKLLNNCSRLQEAFGMGFESLDWSQSYLAVARQRGTSKHVALAQGSLGNALQAIANYPGQDRAQRLLAALDAYNEALRFFASSFNAHLYATAQTNRANLLRELATLPGENRAQRLREALDAYDEALRFYTPDSASLPYATVQNNRANLLRKLATLPNEDRAQRFREALEAYNEALRFRTSDTLPLDYASTQSNRANLLHEIATLPRENRTERLREALKASDEALRFHTPDSTPLAYAAVQNNRAAILCDFATLPGEDRTQRLREALAAYDEALRFRTPDSAPLDYASTQNNRAVLLCDLAALPGEDRTQHLREALAAYDEALRFRTPDSAPLDYASTQNNRAALLLDLATFPGEDHAQRLREALAACNEALRFHTPNSTPLAYATTQNTRAILLSTLAPLPGEDRPQRLRDALAACDEALRFRTHNSAPLNHALTQHNRAILLRDLATLPGEDRMDRLELALRAAWIAFTTFSTLQHQQYQEYAARVLHHFRISHPIDFDILWEKLHVGPLPRWLTNKGFPGEDDK
jgi:hypothetical protein